ncbi:hypothetical protein TrispH2_000483 [Trichoplax sp. H2]|nr:hypothetical protein TrispH2_000483 [Trichoplax sp. H2]|eukprot:RDD47812.1 hypothetical protein TrispH2_000483 [Trichoplax sp. H2]
MNNYDDRPLSYHEFIKYMLNGRFCGRKTDIGKRFLNVYHCPSTCFDHDNINFSVLFNPDMAHFDPMQTNQCQASSTTDNTNRHKTTVPNRKRNQSNLAQRHDDSIKSSKGIKKLAQKPPLAHHSSQPQVVSSCQYPNELNKDCLMEGKAKCQRPKKFPTSHDKKQSIHVGKDDQADGYRKGPRARHDSPSLVGRNHPNQLNEDCSTEEDAEHQLSKKFITSNDNNQSTDVGHDDQAERYPFDVANDHLQSEINLSVSKPLNHSSKDIHQSTSMSNHSNDNDKDSSSIKKEGGKLNNLSAFRKCHHEMDSEQCVSDQWTMFIHLQGWQPLVSDIDWISDQYMAYGLLALLFGHEENGTLYINSVKLIGFVSLVDLSVKAILANQTEAESMPLINFLQAEGKQLQNQPAAFSITSPGFGIHLPSNLKQAMLESCQTAMAPCWYSKFVYVDAFSKLEDRTPLIEVFDFSSDQAKVVNFQLETPVLQ